MVQGQLKGHSQDVKFVKWHPSENLLFSASYDDTIMCWKYDLNIDDWNCAYKMEAHQSTVWCKTIKFQLFFRARL